MTYKRVTEPLGKREKAPSSEGLFVFDLMSVVILILW